MGHYRSEMGFEDADAKEAKRKAKKLNDLTKRIEKDINEKGIARVLAELVEANSWNLFRYPGHY